MTEGIIVAIITGGLAVLSNVISSFQTKKLLNYRMDVLEKKQDKYNGVIERMAKVEESAKSAHKRIDGLENVKRGG